MSKKPIIQPIGSSFDVVRALNENFEALQQGFENTLSRDGSTPNLMEADLDLNSNDILNAKTVNAKRIELNGKDINAVIFDAAQLVEDAEAAAAAAGVPPTSWMDFQRAPMLSVPDGFVTAFNGVQFIRDRSSNINGLGAGAGWKPMTPVSPNHFAVVGDGTANDTVPLRRLHDYANITKAAGVSYAGLTAIRVEANAMIPIYTNVDFAGVPIRVLNGAQVPPLSGTSNTFRFIDPDTPIQSVSGTGLAENLKSGSLTPFHNLWTGTGYVSMFAPKPITNRDRTGTVNYQQSFWSVFGEVVQPLAAELTGYTSLTMEVRKASSSRLTIKNVVLVDDGWNSLTFFLVERNQVDIDGFQVDVKTNRAPMSLDRVIRFFKCGDITLSNVDQLARPYDGVTGGTYGLSFNYNAEVFLKRVRGVTAKTTGWGITGSNYVSGVYCDDCSLNRLDVHAFGYNLYYRGGVLRELGMLVGCGGGVFSVKACRVIGGPAFMPRSDYGNHFESCQVVVDDIDWIPGAEYTEGNSGLVNFARHRAMGGPVDMKAPNVSISNIRVKNPTPGSVFTCSLYNLAVRSGIAGKVFAPDNVTIRGISFDTLMRWSVAVAFRKLEGDGSPKTFVLSDIATTTPGSVPNSTSGVGPGIYELDSDAAAATSANIRIYASNVNTFGFRSLHRAPNRLYVYNSAVTDVWFPDGTFCDTLLSSCLISSGSIWGAFSRIGGGSSSPTLPIKLIGCTVSATPAYDLSGARLLASMDVAAGTILPSGVTATDALTGWRA